MREWTHTFASHREAWAFFHRCEGNGIQAGFPSVDGRHTVRALHPVQADGTVLLDRYTDETGTRITTSLLP